MLWVPTGTPSPLITISQVPSKSPLEFEINGIVRLVASNDPLVIEAAASVAI